MTAPGFSDRDCCALLTLLHGDYPGSDRQDISPLLPGIFLYLPGIEILETGANLAIVVQPKRVSPAPPDRRTGLTD